MPNSVYDSYIMMDIDLALAAELTGVEPDDGLNANATQTYSLNLDEDILYLDEYKSYRIDD